MKQFKLTFIMRFIFITVLSLLLVFSTTTAIGKTVSDAHSPLLNNAEQQLSAEKNRKSILANKLQNLRHNKQQDNNAAKSITAVDLHRAGLAVAIAQADLDNITLTLTAAQQAVALTQNNIQNLQNLTQDVSTLSTTSNQQQSEWQNQIKDQQALLQLQQDRVSVLQDTQDLAAQAITEEQEHKTKLEAAYQLQQSQERQQALDKLAANLQAQQQMWLTRLATLNQQLQETHKSGLKNMGVYANLEINIFEAEEQTNLNEIKLNLARLQDRLADIALTPGVDLSLSALSNLNKQVDALNDELSTLSHMLQDKISLLQKRIKIVTQAVQNNILTQDEAQNSLDLLNTLQVDYQNQLQAVKNLSDKAKVDQNQIIQHLNKQLGARHGLPGWDRQAWLQLGDKMLQIPAVTTHTAAHLPKPIIDTIRLAGISQYITWILFIIAWTLITIKLRSYVRKLTAHFEKNAQDLLVTNAFIVSLKLLSSHLVALMVLIGFIGLLILMGIPLALYSLIINLFLVGIIFSVLSRLTRLSLLESTKSKEGSDVKLYHLLKWVLGIGFVLTILTVIVNQLPVAYDIQDLFGRGFMLFLLIVALVLLWNYDVVPSLIDPYLERKNHHYLKQVIRLLCILVPVSILFNSLIGLVGYVELAWNIAVYQGIFLLVFTGYLLARGILAEIMKLLSEQMIRWFRNGWLWSEAILKPIHQILKIILLLEAIVFLFALYGWGSHSYVVGKITAMMNMQLFVLGGTPITPFTFIMLFILLAILIWAGRWSREFAYRWLFANTKDIGLRNSFAMFTQYITITIIILFALRVLGINLTALTVIASAFAFGVGLGLRDLANNFISGILLLIERPIKVGDHVTIGGFEGEVRHLGVRSIVITNDDHQELMVPNADIFSKSFINWTHHDSIVRKFFTLRVNREDDPHKIKEIILDVLENTQLVETSPKPAVYLSKMEDMLLQFTVEYYIDMRKVRSRDTLQSKILLTIYDQFKTHGIHPPEFPHEIKLLQ